MKITLLTLVGLFILSACAPARPSIPSTLTVDNPTLTESVESPRPRPSRTPRPSQTPYPTHTEWVKVYPTKKALLIYSSSFRSQYTINFIEWGDFYPEPYWVLYEDGQLIFGIGGYEKQLSQADTQAIISKLEQLGLPKLQEAYEANPDSIFTVPPDMEYNPSSSNIEITFDQNGPKSIRYQEYWEEHLIQPMKEIISYLNSFSSAGATPYQPDRLLVVPREIEQIPEGETVIPWPEDVSSPLHRSYKGLYLEGNEALTFYKAAGEYLLDILVMKERTMRFIYVLSFRMNVISITFLREIFLHQLSLLLLVMIGKRLWYSINAVPNNACTRLGVRAAFSGIFLASAGSRFEGESTVPPQAGNAGRWVALSI